MAFLEIKQNEVYQQRDITEFQRTKRQGPQYFARIAAPALAEKVSREVEEAAKADAIADAKAARINEWISESKSNYTKVEVRHPIHRVQCIVCTFYGVGLKEMLSATRYASIAGPRQVAMYLCRTALWHDLTVSHGHIERYSLPYIGKRFKRDHTTVLHAIAKVDQQILKSPKFAANIESLRALVQNRDEEIEGQLALPLMEAAE